MSVASVDATMTTPPSTSTSADLDATGPSTQPSGAQASALGDPSSSLVQLDHITVQYGKHTALKDVSLRIGPGVTGLVGRNGAGKSTLLRLLLGLISATEGTGTLLGQSLTQPGHLLRQSVGFMAESDCLVLGLRGVEQVSLAGELCGFAPSEALARAHESLAYVGLGEARYRQVRDYSTGMQQRLKLACALVHDPQFLLLDEPTIGLDPPGRRRLLDLIVDLAHRHQKSVLISTHLIADIEETCEAVVMLELGQVVAQGKLTDILDRAVPGEIRYRLSWHPPSADMTQALEKVGRLDDDHNRLNPLKGQRWTFEAPFDVRTLFQLAKQHQVHLTRLELEQPELSDLYFRLVEPTARPNRAD